MNLAATVGELKLSDPDLLPVYLAEAGFGWQEIGHEIQGHARCLEIGAGSGLLSYLAAREYPADITAIEPFVDGFGDAEIILDAVRAAGPANLSVHRCTIEDFETSEQFDLIWSINVFEHLPDWRMALLKTRDLLAPRGRAILLVPNYNIPYEPHFRLPLLGGHKLARKLFAGKIEHYEAANRADGLWRSLNFIKASELRSFARENRLHLEIDKSITVRMFDRMVRDRELRERQGVLALPATIFRNLNLHRLWAAMPEVTQPYLRIVLSASENATKAVETAAIP